MEVYLAYNCYMKAETEFFEEQGTLSMQCGMHSINNLLRRRAYSKQQMEDICLQLSDDFINPHKHPLGGDYDANVIIVALQQQGLQVQWMDRRKGFHFPRQANNTLGFLVNTPMPKKIYHKVMGFSARHWTAMRLSEQQDSFWLLDSLQKSARQMSFQEGIEHLQSAMKGEGEVFWVHQGALGDSE